MSRLSLAAIRKDAFAMPVHNPAYPRPPYRFINREYFIISYETDFDALRAIVPEPLQPENNLVHYEFIRMPDSSGFGDYTETGQVITVRDQEGRLANYTHSMYLDDEGPIAGGRELWSFPKKLARPTLSVDGNDTLLGTLDYGTQRVATGTMGYKHVPLDIDIEIDGEYYWDGALVSNRPLTEVLRDADHKDALVFQVDLWSASGNAPGDFFDISARAKDIQYSSRARAVTSMLADRQKHARFIKALLAHIPAGLRTTDPLFRLAEEAADGSAINVMHLIYKNKPYEEHYKDYEFSIDIMREHWESGLEDIRDSFSHREWFDVPGREQGFVTHDVHRLPRAVPQCDRDARILPLADETREPVGESTP